MKRKVSQKQIGAAVGLSQPMVSRFLNNPKTTSVSQEKKELIYSYFNSNNLESINRIRNNIGFIFPWKKNIEINRVPAAYFEFYMHFNEICKQLGKKVMMYSNIGNIEEFLNVSLLEVNGLMVLKAVNCDEIRRLQARHHVLIKNQEPEELICDIVNSDVKGGIRNMAGYLADMNHRRIAFFGLAEPGNVYEENFFVYQQHEGYLQAVRARNLESRENFVQIFEAKRQTIEEIDEFAREAIESWKRAGVLPSAVITGSDGYAISFIRTARDMGYSVPEDFSVTGFDNNGMCEISSPGLTSIAYDSAEIARLCSVTLGKRMEGDKSPPKKIIIPVEIVKRDSVKKLV